MATLSSEPTPEQYGSLGSERQIQIVFDHACDVLDVKATWGWNTRFLKVLGRAQLKGSHVELSSKIWPLATLSQRKEVIYHEIAHIAAFEKYGTSGHDRKWRLCMAVVGYRNAERCHAINVNSLLVKSRYPVFCDCTAHMITKRRLAKMRSGTRLSCLKCKSRIREEK
jgi:predicted SprT family Zn-dependent metalloprotease